jgi:hypothetical protein
VQRSLPGAAALGACGGGEVTTSRHCRRALASSRRSEVCREAEGKGEGSGLFPPFLPGLSDGVRAGSHEGSIAEGLGDVVGYTYKYEHVRQRRHQQWV